MVRTARLDEHPFGLPWPSHWQIMANILISITAGNHVNEEALFTKPWFSDTFGGFFILSSNHNWHRPPYNNCPSLH
jgi:hypothetical protein